MTILNIQNWESTDIVSTSKTINFTFTPTAGSLIVIFATAPARFDSITSGWTVESTFESDWWNVLYSKVSTGSETSFNWTQNGARPAAATVYELPVGSALETLIPTGAWQDVFSNFTSDYNEYGPYSGDREVLYLFGGSASDVNNYVSNGNQTIDHTANVNSGIYDARLVSASASVPSGQTTAESWVGSTTGYMKKITAVFSTNVSLVASKTVVDLSPGNLVDSVIISGTDSSGALVSHSEDSPWLSVGPNASALEPATFNLTANATGLADGLYLADVTFSAPGYDDPVVVSVRFSVGIVAQSIWVPDQFLAGSAATDSSVSLGTKFSFSEQGYLSKFYYWKVGAGDLSGVPIAILNETTDTEVYSGTFNASGTGWRPVTLPNVMINPDDVYIIYIFMASGTEWTGASTGYTSPVTNGSITSLDTFYSYSSSITTPTTLSGWWYGMDVGFVAGAPEPIIIVDTGSITRWLFQGDSYVTNIFVSTSEADSAQITTTKSASWITLSPTSGNEPALFTVTLNATGLAAGNYNGTITFSASGGYQSVVVPVSLSVYPSADLSSMWYPSSYSSSIATGQSEPDYTLGTVMRFNSPGEIFSLFWYKADNASTQPTNLYIARESDWANTVQSVSVSGGLVGGWKRADLPSPYYVEKDTNYIVAISRPTGEKYTFSSNALPVSNSDMIFSGGIFGNGLGVKPTSATPHGYGLDVWYSPIPPSHVLVTDVESFSIDVKKGRSISRGITVQAEDQVGVSISQSNDANWLAISPSLGNGPVTFSLYIDTTSIEIGQYAANITFSSVGYPSLVVPLTLNVLDPNAPLSVWQPDPYPNVSVFVDPTAYNVGTNFLFELPGEITTLWWYRASTKPMANSTIYLSRRSDGQLLSSATLVVGSTTGWKSVDLPAPVQVPKGEDVVVWMNFPASYDLTRSSALFVSGGERNNFINALRGYVSESVVANVPTLASSDGFGFDIGFVSNEISPELLVSTPSLGLILERNSEASLGFTVATSDYTDAQIAVSSQNPWIALDPVLANESVPFYATVSTVGLSAGTYSGVIDVDSIGYTTARIGVYVAVVEPTDMQRVFVPNSYPNSSLSNGDQGYSIGNKFEFSLAGHVSELWLRKESPVLYSPKTIYFRNHTTQELLSSSTIDPGTDTGWLVARLPEAVPVNNTDTYEVFSHFSTGETFTRSNNLVEFGPIVNGAISMVDGGYLATTNPTLPPTIDAPWGYGFDLGFTTVSPPLFIRSSRSSIPVTVETGSSATESFTAEASDFSNVTIAQASNAGWLSATPASGTSPVDFEITVDASGLSEGQYSGEITLSSTGYQSFDLLVDVTVIEAKPTSNPISVENALLGSPSLGFDLTVGGPVNGAPGYMGFSRDYSVNVLDTIEFCVDGVNVTELGIYRIGHYGGDGKRLIATVANSGTAQSGGTVIPGSNGATDMGGWSTTATWTVPADTVSGMFVAATRNASGQAGAWIPFVVRNDGRDADIVVMTSDATWGCAYNYYGTPNGGEFTGASVYGSGGELGGTGPRAYAVSRNRPIVTRDIIVNHWDNLEISLIDWLEENGYDVKYIGSYDLDQQNVNDVLGNSKNLVSIGHDEYWSTGMRENAKAFRDSGKNLIFMSGNEVFWKVFWTDNGRTMWCYKDTLNDGVQINPDVEWTGTWKDTRWVDRQPEYWITGDSFALNGKNEFNLNVVAADYGDSPFWRNTGVSAGTDLNIPYIIGFEANDYLPPDTGAIRLADVYVNIDGERADENGQYYNTNGFLDWGPVMFYATPTAGMTVGFGTCQWQWGLSSRNRAVQSRGFGPTVESSDMKQATTNLLYDLGCYAVTLASGTTEPTKLPLSSYGVIHTGVNPVEPWPDTGIGDFRFGGLSIKTMAIGSSPVLKAYRGSTQIWSAS